MSEILTDAALVDTLVNLCDVDGLGKAHGASTIYASHFALSSRLSALEGENARLREAAKEAHEALAVVLWAQPDHQVIVSDADKVTLPIPWKLVRYAHPEHKGDVLVVLRGDESDSALSSSSPAAGETGGARR